MKTEISSLLSLYNLCFLCSPLRVMYVNFHSSILQSKEKMLKNVRRGCVRFVVRCGMEHGCAADWSKHRLIDWSIDLLVDQCIDWLIDWLIDWWSAACGSVKITFVLCSFFVFRKSMFHVFADWRMQSLALIRKMIPPLPWRLITRRSISKVPKLVLIRHGPGSFCLNSWMPPPLLSSARCGWKRTMDSCIGSSDSPAKQRPQQRKSPPFFVIIPSPSRATTRIAIPPFNRLFSVFTISFSSPLLHQNLTQRYHPNLPEFEKRLAESDAYLKILLDQIKVRSPAIIHWSVYDEFVELESLAVARLTRFPQRGHKKSPKGPPFAHVFWKNLQRVSPLLTFFGKISKGSPLCSRFLKNLQRVPP